jgi:hypothetical protein
MDFQRIAGASTISPPPFAGASCLVTSASFGIISLQAKPELMTCAS